MNNPTFVNITSGTYTTSVDSNDVLIIPNGSVTISNQAIPSESIVVTQKIGIGSIRENLRGVGELTITGTFSLVINGQAL
jgi:hypothetical protein